MQTPSNELLIETEINWDDFDHDQKLDLQSDHVIKIKVSHYFEAIKDKIHQILSENEINRSKRFMMQHDRERYLSTRYALRKIIALGIGTPANELLFSEGHNKKPFIQGIEFNISHSSDRIVIALSKESIGIDVELINKNFDFEPLITECFNKQEEKLIRGSINKRIAFYGLWTRKEGILKATGEGLLNNLKELDCLPPFLSRANQNYHLSTIKTDHDYIISLVRTKLSAILYWNYA
ncbi:4'-phosphopantetheinyl transferase superfamily protein [Pedobacter sp. Leaf250]|uniref:4'-phosphopantetheinyl transferase family protein n=1 Tax=Pedobacter sp. Leaf250 TaxID=2876559 RepID=UPI001E2D68D3|nr:4'-phosphopantetheinyl transferase superfamily protein [Pedobacter sp. Leaf250]